MLAGVELQRHFAELCDKAFQISLDVQAQTLAAIQRAERRRVKYPIGKARLMGQHIMDGGLAFGGAGGQTIFIGAFLI